MSLHNYTKLEEAPREILKRKVPNIEDFINLELKNVEEEIQLKKSEIKKLELKNLDVRKCFLKNNDFQKKRFLNCEIN